jgi:FtsP/CotA-like multicopper oxidase with cupredoxin domain
VNAARSRYFQLELAGHAFTRIGGDGGLLPQAVHLDRLLLTPGERVDAVVAPTGDPGSELAVRWIPYDRGYGSTEFRDPEDVFAIRFAEQPAVKPPAAPEVARLIEPIDTTGATLVEIALTQGSVDDKVVLGINGVPSWEAEPLEAHVDETQVWTVTNEMEWSHPFHLHGFFFQPLDETGAPMLPLEWKDTIDVPHTMGRTSFAVRYDDRAGMWMFHCHILDHADAGMMGILHLMQH